MKQIKIFLAVLLFICLLDMPYGYFQLVRFLSLFIFGILGFKELDKGNKNIAFAYLGLAILFQPIIKISLGRELWNIVDVIVGIWLIISAMNEKPKESRNDNLE